VETIQQERDRATELFRELGLIAESSYQFELWETGGGCTALRLKLSEGRYLLITAEDGGEVPAMNEKQMVGWYRPDFDEPYYLLMFRNTEQLAKFAVYADDMFIGGDPTKCRSWGRALSASHAEVLEHPSLEQRFWARA